MPKVFTVKIRPTTSQDSEFIDGRVAPKEFKQIRSIFERYKDSFYSVLINEPAKKGLHVTSKDIPGLPRSLLISLNKRGELVCLIQVKGHLAYRAEVDKHAYIAGGIPEKSDLYIGQGGFRTVKYLFDLHTRHFYAETINKGDDQEHELNAQLTVLRYLETFYVNSLTCYAKYKNSKGEKVTVTVSPYQKNGTIEKEKIAAMSEQQKIRAMLQLLVGVWALHDERLCHNDLKLTNVLLDDQMNLLLIDFNCIARHRSNTPSSCTPGYESPEIQQCGAPWDQYNTLARKVVRDDPSTMSYQPAFNHQLNDTWSLGVIAYELATNGEEPTLKFIKRTNETVVALPILKQLAHALLRPHRYQRPRVADAIIYLMVLFAERNFKPNYSAIKELDSQSMSGDERCIQIVPHIFTEIADIFLKLPLKLQQQIVNTLGQKSPEFAGLRFHQNMQTRIIAVKPYFHRSEVVRILTVGWSKLPVNDYLCKLRDITQYLLSEYQNEQEKKAYISRIKPDLASFDFATVLLEFYKLGQRTSFTALWEFMLKFPEICNFDLYNFISQISQQDADTFIKEISYEEKYPLMIYLTDNLRRDGSSLAKTRYLVNLGVYLLGSNQDIRPSEQRNQLITQLAVQGITILDQLDLKTRHRYQQLLIQNATAYSQIISASLRQQLSDKQLAIPIFISAAKNFTTAQIFDWMQFIVAKSPALTEQGLEYISKNAKVSKDFWTKEQRDIFVVICEIEKISEDLVSAEHKLYCLEQIFNALQSNPAQFYQQRHPKFDAVGEFFWREQKVTQHRSLQLSILRKVSYRYLIKAAEELRGSEQGIKLLAEYKHKDIFKFHRDNSIFNFFRKTHHQNLIASEIKTELKRGRFNLLAP